MAYDDRRNRERRPAHFVGVTTYQDPKGRFSVRVPTDWLQLALLDQEGAQFRPEPEDPYTYLMVWVKTLEASVVADDLADLREGVKDGLAQLAEVQIEGESELVLGNLIRFERVFTCREDGATRKRRIWMLYVDKYVIALTWQGATLEDYEHWLAMANYSYATFTLPQWLWFASDPDMDEFRKSVLEGRE
jgi:hypothetical protein